MAKKSITMKKKGVKRGAVITLTTKQARIKQYLGNGFYRLVFTGLSVPANGYRTYRFVGNANGRDVYPVNGGWFITDDTSLPAFATASYPQNERTWVITLQNPTTQNRTAQFFFIVKTPE